MTCQELDNRLADYLAGALVSSDAAQLELHAAFCPQCEARLELATRLPVGAVVPALPPSLRTRTLAAVALRRGDAIRAREREPELVPDDGPENGTQHPRELSDAERPASRRWARWWSGGAALAAAAAVLFVVNSPTARQAPSLVLADSSRAVSPSTASTAPASAVPSSAVPSSAVPSSVPTAGDAEGLAVSWSQPEFAALDQAAEELRAALANAPNDDELRAFLSSVTARRDELARRVKDAAS